jgi:hypothetical protein
VTKRGRPPYGAAQGPDPGGSLNCQMVLGPGKEFALIVPLGVDVAAPSGWSAIAIERVRVDAPL